MYMDDSGYQAVIKSIKYNHSNSGYSLPRITSIKIPYRQLKHSLSQRSVRVRSGVNSIEKILQNSYQIFPRSSKDIITINPKPARSSDSLIFSVRTYSEEVKNPSIISINPDNYYEKRILQNSNSMKLFNSGEVYTSYRNASTKGSRIYKSCNKPNLNNGIRKVKTSFRKINGDKGSDSVDLTNSNHLYKMYNLADESVNTSGNNLSIITLPSMTLENSSSIRPVIYDNSIKNYNNIQITKEPIVIEVVKEPLIKLECPIQYEDYNHYNNYNNSYNEIQTKQINHNYNYSRNKPKIEIPTILNNNYSTIQSSNTNYKYYPESANEVYSSIVINNMFQDPIIPPIGNNPIPKATITQPYETNGVKHIFRRKQKPQIQTSFDSSYANENDPSLPNNLKYSNYQNHSNSQSHYETQQNYRNHQNYQNNYVTQQNYQNYQNHSNYKNHYETQQYVTQQNYQNHSNYQNDYSDDPLDGFNPNEFDIIKGIGKGEISKIFSVRWKKNGKKYAMKQLIAFNKEFVKNERKQADVIRNFINSTNCDGVIKVFGECMSSDYNTQYILMELGDYDWNKQIEKRQTTSNHYNETELLSILYQLVKTLSLLEKHKISHRDIKPENVLIVNGKYKITDFGDSIVSSEGQSQQLVRGTELFMSPLVYKAYRSHELVVHDTFKSDVYSLGICMLLAATFDIIATIDIKNVVDSSSRRAYIKKCLYNRYSNKFISIMCRILEYDEVNRPNFRELECLLMNEYNVY